jgi:DNA polymerase-1
MGAQGLANQIDVPLADAEALLERYFRAFPKIRDYLNQSARNALSRGWAETMAGRRFWFLDMRREGRDEATLLRIAKNMPIQGANADITKLAMARVVRAIRDRGLDAYLVNMVHDEILVESAEGQAEEVRALVVREMISAGSEFIRVVPVEIDAKIGDHWEK